MKQLVILVAAAFVLCHVPPAAAGEWGIGGFGGINIPIEQDHARNGIVYGLKGRWSPFWSLAFEPQVFLLKNGDYDVVYDGESESLKSWKATSFGLNAVLGAPARIFTGVRPLIFAGVRLNSVDFDGQDAKMKFGFGVGVGLEIAFDRFGLEIRGGGEAFPERKYSLKNGTITGGLNLYLGQ